jgi:hypothetical protein
VSWTRPKGDFSKYSLLVTHLVKTRAAATQQQRRSLNPYATWRRPKADEVWLSKEDNEYVVGNLKPGELYKVNRTRFQNEEGQVPHMYCMYMTSDHKWASLRTL